MGIKKDDPMKDLLSIKERVNKLFEDVMERDEGGSPLHNTWSPLVDIYETGDAFVVKAELPEVREENVEIKVEDDVLIIRGERTFKKDIQKNNFHRVERKYGLFRRSFSLPSLIDQDGINANLRDGILTIHLPKKAQSETVHIEIS